MHSTQAKLSKLTIIEMAFLMALDIFQRWGMGMGQASWM